jgi:hypothetical protein
MGPSHRQTLWAVQGSREGRLGNFCLPAASACPAPAACQDALLCIIPGCTDGPACLTGCWCPSHISTLPALHYLAFRATASSSPALPGSPRTWSCPPAGSALGARMQPSRSGRPPRGEWAPGAGAAGDGSCIRAGDETQGSRRRACRAQAAACLPMESCSCLTRTPANAGAACSR